MWLEHSDGIPFGVESPIDAARRLLLEGAIVAIKGLGGFHLACDATKPEAVMRLRARKRRYHKPFALMARDLAVIQALLHAVDPKSSRCWRARPRRSCCCAANGPERLPDAVAPGSDTLGFMLPYTPLHHLLLEGLERPIVLTSGNVSDEPQCIGNEQAREQLRAIADYLLLHDRDIVNRVDDSVVRIMDGAPRCCAAPAVTRRRPLPLPPGFERAHFHSGARRRAQKHLLPLKDGQAILSQHQGDLEDAATFRDYQRNLELYRRLFEHEPQTLAVDRHPEYLSTKLGREWSRARRAAARRGAASSCAYRRLPRRQRRSAGCASGARRRARRPGLRRRRHVLGRRVPARRLSRLRAVWRSFKPVAMLGGAQAMREPWRNTYAHLATALGWARLRAGLRCAGAVPVS